MFISSYTLWYINKPHFIFKGENWAYIEFHEQCEDSSGIASRLVYIRKRFWLIGQWAKVIFTSSALHNIFLKVLHSPLRELMNIDDPFSTNFRRYSRPCFYSLYKVMNNKNDIHLSVSCVAYKLNFEQQRSWKRKKRTNFQILFKEIFYIVMTSPSSAKIQSLNIIHVQLNQELILLRI